MEMMIKELNQDTMREAAGGSIFNKESSIREAGIELWKYYRQIPGEFGTFFNIGAYYFKGELITQHQIDALEAYRKKFGEVAPSLEEAVAAYHAGRC